MSWLQLHAILREQAAEADYYATQAPAACPHDGTPLLQGPPSEPGVLYCPHDGWRYPRDWDPLTMSGL